MITHALQSQIRDIREWGDVTLSFGEPHSTFDPKGDADEPSFFVDGVCYEREGVRIFFLLHKDGGVYWTFDENECAKGGAAI